MWQRHDGAAEDAARLSSWDSVTTVLLKMQLACRDETASRRCCWRCSSPVVMRQRHVTSRHVTYRRLETSASGIIPNQWIAVRWRFADLFGIYCICFTTRGQDSRAITATGYALDGPDIESRWGRGFPCSPDWPRIPLSLLYNWYRGFPG
jgi:hypothetical protein